MKVKHLINISFLSLALIITACSDGDKLKRGVGKLIGENENTGGSSSGIIGVTTGNTGGGSTTSTNTNTSWACQHPSAVNSTPICNELPGPCIFYACKDNRYAEYEVYLGFQRYVDEHGGEIYHDPNLCQTLIPDDGKCQHPEAENYDQVGKCEFKACNDPEYLEYQQYLDFQAYVSTNGGTVEHDQSKCITKKELLGCMESRAENYNPNATVPSECTFKACTDSSYQGHNQTLIDEFNDYINNIGGGEIIHDQSLCGDQKVSGCQLLGASNYVANAEIPTACIFKACTEQGQPGYNQQTIDQINFLLSQYSAGGSIENDPNLCSGSGVSGCMLPGAENYNPVANEPASCTFKLCTDQNYLGYSATLVTHYQNLIANYSGGGSIENDQNLCGEAILEGCMLPGAENYNPLANKATTCQFKACTDQAYLGYNQGLIDQYQNLLNNYPAGGSVDHDQNLCGEQIVLGCLSPLAKNFDVNANKENGSCIFEGCLDENAGIYYNHALQHAVDLYQSQLSTANITFTGQIIGNVDCEKMGCTHNQADNWDPTANKEDGSCNFSGCFDSNFAEYDPNKYAIAQDYINSLTDQNIVHTGSLISVGCITPNKIEGCMEEFAVNYNENATHENGSCLFKTCIDPAYEEYNEEHKLAIEEYILEFNLDLSQVLESTCTTPKKPCHHPEALNYTGPPGSGLPNPGANHPFINYVCDDFNSKNTFCSQPNNQDEEICTQHLDYINHCSNPLNINSYYCHIMRIYKSYCDPNTSQSPQYCIFKACTMEGYEGYDQYLEYLDYINQYGGEIIEDNSAESCGDIISTTGTTSGTSSTFNIDIEYQTINTCTEDVDIHLIFDNSSSMSNILTKVKQAIQNYSTLLAGTNSSIKFYSLCSVDSNVMQQQISNNPLTIKKTYSLPAPTAVVNINSQMDINQISIDIASKLNTIQLLQLEKEKGMCFIARLIDEEISNQINKKTIISIVTDENDYYGQYNGYIHNYCPTANYCLKSYEIVTQNFQGIYKAKLRLIKLTGSHVINNEVKTYYSYGHFNDPSGYFNLAKYNDLLNNGQRSCTAQEKSWFENYNGVYPIDNCTIKAVTGYTYFKKPIKLKNAIGANNCGATNFTVDGVTYPNMEQYFVDTTNYPLDQYKSCYYSNISGTLNTTQNHLNYNDYANAPTISDAHINMLNNYNAQTKAKVGFSHVIYDNNNNSCTGIESANKQHGSAYLSLHQKLENNQYLSKVGDVCSTDHNPSLSQLISTTTHQVPKLKYYIPNWPPMNPQIMSIDVNLIPANGNPLPVSSQDYGISTDAQGTYILFNSNLTTVLQNYQSIKIDIEYN